MISNWNPLKAALLLLTFVCSTWSQTPQPDPNKEKGKLYLTLRLAPPLYEVLRREDHLAYHGGFNHSLQKLKEVYLSENGIDADWGKEYYAGTAGVADRRGNDYHGFCKSAGIHFEGAIISVPIYPPYRLDGKGWWTMNHEMTIKGAERFPEEPGVVDFEAASLSETKVKFRVLNAIHGRDYLVSYDDGESYHKLPSGHPDQYVKDDPTARIIDLNNLHFETEGGTHPSPTGKTPRILAMGARNLKIFTKVYIWGKGWEEEPKPPPKPVQKPMMLDLRKINKN